MGVNLRQELTIVIEPCPYNGYALDVQRRSRSLDGSPVELGRTNFGFLGGSRREDDVGTVRRRALTMRMTSHEGHPGNQVAGSTIQD